MVIIDEYEQLFSKHHRNDSLFINGIVNHKVLSFQQCDLIVSTCHATLVDLNQYENQMGLELTDLNPHLQCEQLLCHHLHKNPKSLQ